MIMKLVFCCKAPSFFTNGSSFERACFIEGLNLHGFDCFYTADSCYLGFCISNENEEENHYKDDESDFILSNNKYEDCLDIEEIISLTKKADPEKIKTFEEFMFHNTYEYERTKPSFKLILTES
jgi:hypothetical protein